MRIERLTQQNLARCAGVLLRGGIEEFLYDENGNQITVAHIHEGQIFGAELACSGGVTSPVCLRTASVCTVMLLNFGVLLSESSMGCPCRMQVTANLMREFARQVLAFNTKVRILGQKRLRDRLKIYLQTLTACTPFHIPAPRWPIFSVWIEARFPANSAACAMKGYSPFRAAKSVCSILSFCMREQRRGAASVPYTPEFPNAKAVTTEKKT